MLIKLILIAAIVAGIAKGNPVNPNATFEAKALFSNLMKIQQEDRLLFGQYDGTYEGRASTGDIYDMTGVKPGMNEWHVPYLYNFQYESKMARLHEDYNSGMLIGFFWRMYNPITGGESHDTSDGAGGTINIDTLLPGGIYYTNYLAQLDIFVEICDELPKINGEPIPVFLRFLPEMSMGSSRWYKSAYCTPDQYRQLWQTAHDYLVLSNGLNNILWQFNPNNTFDTTTNRYGYKEYYPGHDLVDICGRNTPDDEYLMGPNAMDSMRHAISVAAEAGKLVAISQQNSYHNNADLNMNGIVDPDEFTPLSNWWTEVWLDRLIEDDLLNKIAFSCAWKSGGTGEDYFIPYKGHEHESNFEAMCAMPEIMLATDVPYLYSPTPLSNEIVFEFIESEGFTNGELVGQQGWIGDSDAFIIDTNNLGRLDLTNSWSTVTYGPGTSGGSGTEFKIGIKFNFQENKVADNNKQILQLLFFGEDSDNINVNFKRQESGNYIMAINEYSGESSTKKGMSVAYSDIGTTNGPAEESAELFFDLELTKGVSESNWIARSKLFNLDVDPGKLYPLDSVELVFTSTINFYDGLLKPGLRVAAPANAKVINLSVDSIQIDALPNPFAIWAHGYNLQGVLGEMTANPDNDQLDNLAEFALGGNPTNSGDEAILPILKRDGDWNFVYRRRLDAVNSGLEYSVETSTNLVSNIWTTNGIIETTTGNINDEFESVTNTLSIDGLSEQFFRLRITGE